MNNAIAFLLYSYFGVTLENTDDEILSAIISRAQSDATQQGAYNTLIPKKDTQRKERSNQALSDASQLLANHLRDFSEPVERDAFDEWHSELCKDLTGKFDASLPFVFGNAQKWVNMSLKYLLLFCDVSDGQKYSAIGNIRGWLHIPVDSFIIEKVWDDTDIPLPFKKKKWEQNREKVKYDAQKVKVWSKWERKPEYEDFLRAMRTKCKTEAIAPIDWEGQAWIEIARKRKGKK